MDNKKKIKKSIESFGEQIEKHEEKIKGYRGKDYALIDYWNKEIEGLEKQKKKKEEKLERK